MTKTMLEASAAEAGKQVIGRAVAVLLTLERQPRGLNMSEIARASRLPRTTVQRLVGALVAQQFLALNAAGRVRLGPALARLAAAAHADVIAVIHPHLEALRRRVEETVHLWVVSGHDTVLVDQVVCDHEIRIVRSIGVGFPLGCSAGGKAILAGLPETEVRRLVEGRLKAHTPHSIVSVDRLLADLDDVRLHGVAFDMEEHAEGVSAIGAALRPDAADQFAICVTAPTSRFQGKRDRLVQAIIECRDRINAELGG